MNLPFMIFARAVQGVGASMIAAAAPLIITRFLPETKRGLGMGVIATTGGIALTFGPPLGGIITEYLSWHWIFLLNIPIGIAAVICARTFIPHPNTPPVKKPFDWIGTFLMFAAVAALVLLIERVASLGWVNPATVTVTAVFIAAAAAYIIHSLKSRHPLINIRIFKHWKFTFRRRLISFDLHGLRRCHVHASLLHGNPTRLKCRNGGIPAYHLLGDNRFDRDTNWHVV